MTRWELHDGMAQVGPLDEDHVVRMIAAGIPKATLARPVGSEQWQAMRAHAPFAMALERTALAEPHPPQALPPAAYATHQSAERVFYESPNVVITGQRAIIAGTTYALANVTSVRVVLEDKPLAPLLLGCLLALLGLALIGALRCVTVGGAMLVMGATSLVIWAMTPTKHWVRIGTSGAESNAVSFRTNAQAQVVVAALNNAIISRG